MLALSTPRQGGLLRGFLSRQVVFFLLNSLIWLGFLFVGLTVANISRSSLPNIEWFVLYRSLAGFAISTALHLIIRRPYFTEMPRVKRWVLGWVLCFSFCVLVGFLLYPPHHRMGLSVTEMIRLFPARLFILTIWLVMYFGIHAAEEHFNLVVHQLQLDKARLSEKLSMLQAQIAPHFLFNSLNAVLANKDDPAKVVDVTESLAAFLRFSLGQTKPLNGLGVELDALEQYLCVQQHRFGERLTCSMEYDAAARGTLVPTLIVQPLLENAINYGKPSADGILRVRVVAFCEAERLLIKVHNTGDWLAPEPERSLGTGLLNLRRRLHLIYGDAASFDVFQDGEWVTAVVDLPMKPPVS